MNAEPLIASVARSFGLPFTIDETNVHVATALLVAILIALASLFVWARMKHTDKRLVPADRVTLSTMFEVVVEFVLTFMESILGKDARRYLPLICSVFIYIFSCNVIGVIPGFSPPTSNINTNLAVALCVFVYYNYVGIRKHGLMRYIKHLSGPVLWLAPLMLTIELVSHFVRPISLSVRLFGNMMGDHMVLEIFNDLVPVLVPVLFIGLTIFVAFIQAFVFSLLSTIYIALATEGTHV